MFAAGLSPSELGLKASLKESLSFGGRVDVKSRSHNAADASHIEDSPHHGKALLARPLPALLFLPCLLYSYTHCLFLICTTVLAAAAARFCISLLMRS
jgi:hypothetical protein